MIKTVANYSELVAQWHPKAFDDLREKRFKNGKIKFLIEYHGNQHYLTESFFDSRT